MSGEYFVLDGAKALAVPTLLGQTLKITERVGSEIVWKSLDQHGKPWFEAKFELLNFDPISTTDENISKRLQNIFKSAIRLNSDFLSKWKRYVIETKLEFDPKWGLGSSSTLIYNIAQWAEVNPYLLLFKTFGGSGYDIACADADGPVFYQKSDEALHVNAIDINPKLKKNLYFIYSGQKQNSADEVQRYQEIETKKNGIIGAISDLSTAITTTSSVKGLDNIIQEHEKLVSSYIKKPPVQESLFKDYWGSVKSLGAWGGDFMMATSKESKSDTVSYFKNKGFHSVFSYDELIYDES